MLQILKNSHFKLCFELHWEQCLRLSFCFMWTEEIQSRRNSLLGFGIGECHKPSAFPSRLCQKGLSWDVPWEPDSVSGEFVWLQMKSSPAASTSPDACVYAKEPGSGKEQDRRQEAAPPCDPVGLSGVPFTVTSWCWCWWRWDITTPLFPSKAWSLHPAAHL